MNAQLPSLSLLAAVDGLDRDPLMLIAAGMVVIAAILGLAAGFYLGSLYGRMSGELKMLKAMGKDRARRVRSSSDSD